MISAAAGHRRSSITVLQWTLGVVVLIEASLFVMPHAGHEFGRMHMPQAVRLSLGWAEIVAAILFLIPKTMVRGAWLLLVVFLIAIAIHLLHGMVNVGAVVVYAATVWTVTSRRDEKAS